MDDTAISVLKAVIVPAVTVGTSVLLFWLKFYSDARKRLDDLLIELEHELYLSQSRQQVFSNRYLEIRKAVTDFDRWILDATRKKALEDAFRRFRGQRFTTESILDLRGGPHEPLIDVFLTGAEVRCLAPHELSEYLNRIAALRKITGSRKRVDGKAPVV